MAGGDEQVGHAGAADDGRTVGRHRPQAAPELAAAEVAAVGKQVGDRARGDARELVFLDPVPDIEQEAPAGFAIGKECELKSADESQAVVRYARHPLLTDEVKAHLAQGKQPTRLALEWDDRVSFVLGDNLQLKKLAFDDKVLEQAKAQGQRADDFDGNVLMVTAELSPLIGDLIDALDGLAVPGGTPAPAQAAPSTAPAPAASAATDDHDPPF